MHTHNYAYKTHVSLIGRIEPLLSHPSFHLVAALSLLWVSNGAPLRSVMAFKDKFNSEPGPTKDYTVLYCSFIGYLLVYRGGLGIAIFLL